MLQNIKYNIRWSLNTNSLMYITLRYDPKALFLTVNLFLYKQISTLYRNEFIVHKLYYHAILYI